MILGRQFGSDLIEPDTLPAMEALMKCIDMGWLAILTGTRGCGKTTLVRQIAMLQGRKLREFSMSAEVDTLELLGSFEQAERTREMDAVVVDALAVLDQAVLLQATDPDSQDVHTPISQLRQLRVDLSTSGPDVDLQDVAARIRQALSAVSNMQLESRVQDISNRLEAAADASPISARFEWVDGPLIRAMTDGDWLLVEDANLCSPSVLDRLNSLFETGGRLQLAERGPVNGEIQIIEPHPDFRLVMTLDPRNGELSRAMRNRGIEIALLPPRTSDADTAGADMTTRCEPVASDEDSPLAGVEPLELEEPIFESLRVASLPSLGQPGATAHHLLSTSARAHHGLLARILKSTNLQSAKQLDFAIRSFNAHALVHAVEQEKQVEASSLNAPERLLLSQVSQFASHG